VQSLTGKAADCWWTLKTAENQKTGLPCSQSAALAGWPHLIENYSYNIFE
jgi:hypothetical protein